jgi:hypothetical protein
MKDLVCLKKLQDWCKKKIIWRLSNFLPCDSVTHLLNLESLQMLLVFKILVLDIQQKSLNVWGSKTLEKEKWRLGYSLLTDACCFLFFLWRNLIYWIFNTVRSYSLFFYHGLFPRLYEGRVVQGPLRGTQAVFKVCIELSLC